ncbi:hypothetical protein MUN88_18540 [Gracilibacillus caseinilyticus]|uniref:Uncharacterized protein n=1 Tax=Gracilibacillus caseinilyticus TaxID=2932256 RepID=A0ABY4EUX8_9BACI|nr:hypothetical protein [Gracilibacillus caseinilyticus]UOQ48028.1 hypothetical protein MUN88_18540 [Gracilibacillus caseinilyticus]
MVWKRFTFTIIVIACIGAIMLFVTGAFQKPVLAETVKLEKQYEDFIVHIRIEPIEDGFQVLRSLQYTGEASLVIEHRSPLTQVTIDADNPTFTGSPVTKQLNADYQYYPQAPLLFETLEKGNHTVYIHTQFYIDGERVDIKTKETITFE